MFASLERKLDNARMAAMKAAQQVDCVGKVAANVRSTGFDQGIQVNVARRTFARNAGELGLSDADRKTVGRPIECHSCSLNCHIRPS
jgi:hypothetical protein